MLENKIIRYIGLIMGLFIFIPFRIKPIVVVLIFIYVLFYNNKQLFNRQNIFKISIISSILFIYIISFFFSENKDRALDYLIRSSPFIFLPTSFYLLKKEALEVFFNYFLKSFIISNSVYIIVMIFYVLNLGYLSTTHDLNYYYSYITFAFFSMGDHPIYLSIQFAISILFLIRIRINKVLKVVLFLILLMGLFFLSRKGVIISFFVALAFYFYFEFNRAKSLMMILSILILFTLSFLVPEIKERYFEVFEKSNLINNSKTSSGIRTILWYNSIELIKENLVFGCGIGDSQEVLSKHLKDKGYIEIATKKSNCHNQYLQFLLSIGIIGLLVFICSIFYFFYFFKSQKNFLGLSILIMFLILFLTESFLDRQNGIILYTLFLTIVTLNHKQINGMKSVLIIGQFPYPIKGISLANITLYNGLKSLNHNVDFINTESSEESIDVNFGVFSLKKLIFIKHYFNIYKIFNHKNIYITVGITFFGVLKYAPFILLSKFLNKNLIVHVHSNYLSTEYERLKGFKKNIFERLLKSFNKGIVLSDGLRHNLEPFLSKKDIYSIPNFIQKDLLKDVIIQKDYSKIKLFFLSNLLKEKGINILLNVIERLQNQNNIFLEVKIAGAIEKSNPLSKLNSLKNVEYLGIIEGKKKQNLLLWGNVFCLPTFFSMEGQPISIIESMAFENFIITTKHAGITDICSSNNALFCEKNSEESLYNTLLELYNNWDIYSKQAPLSGENARQIYKEENFIFKINKLFI